MKDQLSALMDGEFAIADAEHLITSAKAGGEMKQSWASYHLIGDAMRGETYLSHDFSSRVMAALEAEPTLIAPSASHTNVSMLKTSVKSTKFWSVAASVAAVMFVGMTVFQQQASLTDELSPVEIAQNLPMEYLAAHQAAAPSSAAYYIQNASYTELAK
jgi:sigma-E factor negative regulatory protein RseA